MVARYSFTDVWSSPHSVRKFLRLPRSVRKHQRGPALLPRLTVTARSDSVAKPENGIVTWNPRDSKCLCESLSRHPTVPTRPSQTTSAGDLPLNSHLRAKSLREKADEPSVHAVPIRGLVLYRAESGQGRRASGRCWIQQAVRSRANPVRRHCLHKTHHHSELSALP